MGATHTSLSWVADVEMQPYPYGPREGHLEWDPDTAGADFQRLTIEEEQSDIINAISNSAGTIPTETDEKPNMSSVKKVRAAHRLPLEAVQRLLHRRVHRRSLGQLPNPSSDHGGDRLLQRPRVGSVDARGHDEGRRLCLRQEQVGELQQR